jgi:hypothetical protein
MNRAMGHGHNGTDSRRLHPLYGLADVRTHDRQLRVLAKVMHLIAYRVVERVRQWLRGRGVRGIQQRAEQPEPDDEAYCAEESAEPANARIATPGGGGKVRRLRHERVLLVRRMMLLLTRHLPRHDT